MKHLKKIILLAACVVMCIACTACAPSSLEKSRDDTAEYVTQNLDTLTIFANKIISDKPEEYTNLDRYEVCYFDLDETDFAVFDYSVGMLSDRYYGFYYSPNDIPMNRDSSSFDLQQDESGWYHSEDAQSSYYYTDRITDNWFFYYIGSR